MKRLKRTVLLGVAMAAATGLAAAHGDEAHDKAAKAHAGAPEQQAWGIAGLAKKAKRTVEIRMGDNMRFTPELIEVHRGETLRLSLHNDGKALHEFVLGTKKELDEHAALMVKFPNMEHSEPYMAHVAPGTQGEIVWTFNRAGEFDFACLIAGHYQAGMVGRVKVVTP